MWQTEGVELRCTCGARPPEDARFCHKCGRPLFEPEVAEEPEIVAPVEAAPAPPPLPVTVPDVSFHNGPAVRACFWAATIASLLFQVHFPMSLEFLWVLAVLCGAGVLSVWLYQRHTQQALSVRNGVRIGWITGIFLFCIITVVMTINYVAGPTDQEFMGRAVQQMREQGLPEASTKQFQDAINTPGVVGTLLLIMLPILFALFTILSVTGGLLGARFFRSTSK